MADRQEPALGALTADEREILDWYRRLPEKDRKNLLDQARSNDKPTNKGRRGFWAGD